MPEVIVIGGGVIGLSCASMLQSAGLSVRVITRERLDKTTSMAAGAMWSATGLTGRQRRWADASLNRFVMLSQLEGTGVALQRMREVYSHPVPDPWYRDQLPMFRRMPRDELPRGMADGFLMTVPLIAPPIYLQYLSGGFVAKGGRMEHREIESMDELADEAPLLINCSGVGARKLAGDDAVYPIRGQTVLVDAPHISEGYMDNSEVVHIFPREDGVLLGGIKQAHDWDRAIDRDIEGAVFADCARIEPSLADAKPLRRFSGSRPGRHAPRLEKEALTRDCYVIHNYGHGAIGYTLSWGCAEDVALMADAHFRSGDFSANGG